MENGYFTCQEYKHVDFTETGIQKGEYENCLFINCIFQGIDLTEIGFEECEFLNCDFSNTRITNTAFRDVKFADCKLIGIQFDTCNRFLLTFDFVRCQLNYSSFYKLNVAKTRFTNCILQEVDFTETDLHESVFENCDFSGAMFGHSNLEKTDFRTSFNFIIDPEKNRLKEATFSMFNLVGLLSKYGINVDKSMV